MTAMRLTGYSDKFSVHPGDTIKFYVNCAGPAEYSAEIVHLIHGDTNPRGPGVIEPSVLADVNKTYKGRRQIIHSGSYGYVADTPLFHTDSFTLQCWIWSTTPKTDSRYWKHGAQGIVTHWCGGKGYGLFINEEGALELRIAAVAVGNGLRLRDHAWHFIAATYDAATGKAVLFHEPQVVYALDPEIAPVEATVPSLSHCHAPLVIGGYTAEENGAAKPAQTLSGCWITGHYNGKIDSPRLCNRALSRLEIEMMKGGVKPALSERRHSGPTGALSEAIIGAWDFSDGIDTLECRDQGPFLLHGRFVNCPTRAMTGYNWSGTNFDWKHAASEYGAVHFHDDDLDDARWEVDFEWTVPAGTKSRFYAAKLTTADGDEDYIPFWVVPRLGEATRRSR